MTEEMTDNGGLAPSHNPKDLIGEDGWVEITSPKTEGALRHLRITTKGRNIMLDDTADAPIKHVKLELATDGATCTLDIDRAPVGWNVTFVDKTGKPHMRVFAQDSELISSGLSAKGKITSAEVSR